MKRRYAICNETFGAMPLEDALAMAASAGYTGWEVAPFMLGVDGVGATQIDRITPAARAAYRETVDRAGLQIVGLHWLLAKTRGFHLTTGDDSVRRHTAAYLGKLAELCRDLGGEVMVLGSPEQRNFPPSQTWQSAMDNAAEVLRGVAPVLRQTGVRIAIEPLGRREGNFLTTADEAVKLIQRVNDPNVRLHLDVKAMSDEPTPIPQIIANHADHTIHFHANDPNRRGPGMGEVDFAPILAALAQTGYEGWISIEVFDDSVGVEPMVRQSIANLEAAEPQQ